MAAGLRGFAQWVRRAHCWPPGSPSGCAA
jgi:hypothetical protein